MSTQGSLELLNQPVAQSLLQSTSLAHLAYVWPDGTPRVVPLWFHWNGHEIVFGTPAQAPKVRVLATGSRVAVSIDSDAWPYRALQVRGDCIVETVAGVVPEYARAAERYFGIEQGRAWLGQVEALFAHMVRIAVRPEWVAVLDFEQRFPSAIEAAMAAGTQH